MPSITGSKVRARLAALSSIVVVPTTWIGRTSKEAVSVPSFELLSIYSLSMIGSLGVSLEARGALEGVDALVGTDVLDVAEWEPPS